MALIDDIKLSMRISHDVLDTVIINDIDTAISDLVRVGIQPYQTDANGDYVLTDDKRTLKDDKLINKAAELYCKSQMNYLEKGEQFEASYSKLRDAMSLSGDYV